MGLRMCFLYKTLFSNVVIVCLVPDNAIYGLSEYAQSNFGFVICFSENVKGQLLTPSVPFLCFIGSWSETLPAPLNEYTPRVYGFTKSKFFCYLFQFIDI